MKMYLHHLFIRSKSYVASQRMNAYNQKAKHRVNRTTITFYGFICLIMTTACLGQQPADEASTTSPLPSWEGVWVAERQFGPLFRGPLTLQRSEAHWVARLQGEIATAERKELDNGIVHWSFAFSDQGRFEGQQPKQGAPIDGHWFQPPGIMANFSAATPVRLIAHEHEAFSGEVTPLKQQVSLNIVLIANDSESGSEDNQYRTFLRNPERNLGLYFRIESATVEGDEIRFANGDSEVIAVGNIREPGERFSMLFPRFGEYLDFTRRSRQEAPGYYSRRSPSNQSVLLQPVQVNDGWSTARAAEAGLDEGPLLELVNLIAASKAPDVGYPYIHSLLVAHKGKLVMEEYFHGYDQDTPHDFRSASKTLTSALLGAAIYQGVLADVEQPVYPMFGGVDAFANPDPRKERMTARHLVSMTSGFDCDDSDNNTPGNEDTMQNQNVQSDWYRYTLDLPMVREPGEQGVYCTAGINLIGGLISKTTGMSLPRFFHESFAKPLSIPYYQMNLTPDNRAYMGGGLRLRPRDFLKLGQLYLNGGVWNGQRIVSEDWVRESTAPHTSINQKDDYGFAWWRQSLDVEGKNIETYMAVGNGGQMMVVVPALDLIVLLNAGNYGDGLFGFLTRRMKSTFIPAVMASE